MNPDLLDNQECLKWLANNMLNRERMPKVIEQYNGYAGILDVDSNFRCEEKVDMGIVNSKTKAKEDLSQYVK